MTLENKDDFVLPIFKYEKEIESFAHRMQPYVQSLELLNVAIDQTLVQIRPAGRLDTTIYMLGRLCMRQFEALFVLATLGHGISWNRLLRSLFEKVVDLEYLSSNPDKIDDLWDFYFVELTKLDMADQAAKIDVEYEQKIERFKKPQGGFQMRWTGLDLVSQAKAVGFDDGFLRHVYRMPNGYVHTSVGEIMESFITEEDGTLSAVTEASDADHRTADRSLLAATDLMRIVLESLIEHFQLTEPKEKKQFFDNFQLILVDIG